MKTHFNQDHIAPVAVQHPLLAQHLATRANRVTESPAGKAADPDRDANPQKQTGSSRQGTRSLDLAEIHPDFTRAKSVLESAGSTLNQLSDLLDGVYSGVASSGYGPSSARNNQRLLKSAVSAASEIVSHSQSGGEPIFRVQLANLMVRSLPNQTQLAVAAYTKSAEFTPHLRRDHSLIQQTMRILNLHVTGPAGILADLQTIAENGPHSTERVKRTLIETQSTITSLQQVISDSANRLDDQAQLTGLARATKSLNRFL